MIKKSLPLVLILITILLVITIQATDITSTAEKYTGGLDPETGLPEKLTPLAETGEKLTEGEITTEYLKQEWTKILEKSQFGKYLLVVMNFTGKIFSFFNPLWKYTFGTEFSWTWTFFLSFFIWIVLVIVLYSPSKAFLNLNPIFILIFAIVLASLAGSGGVIRTATDFLSIILTNIWLVGVSIFIGVLLVIFYYKFFGDLEKDLKKESDEEKRKRAQQTIEAHGEVSRKALEDMGKSN